MQTARKQTNEKSVSRTGLTYHIHLTSSYGKIMLGVQEKVQRQGIDTVFHLPSLCLDAINSILSMLRSNLTNSWSLEEEYWHVMLSKLPEEPKNIVLNTWVPWGQRYDKKKIKFFRLETRHLICLIFLAEREKSQQARRIILTSKKERNLHGIGHNRQKLMNPL